MIEVNRKGEVWIFAEQEAGKLSDVPLELLTKARELADTLEVSVGAMLLGSGVKALADKLVAHGADKVYLVDDEDVVRDALAWLLRSRRLLSEGFASAEAFDAFLEAQWRQHGGAWRVEDAS